MRILLLLLLILGNSAFAADTNTPPSTTENPWSYSASAYTYIIPDSREYVQPTITVDRNMLHFEARYNYEALETGSAWIGANFSFGDKLSLELTPMVGGIFGDVYGIAPGYKYTLGWWKLELYSEGEYLYDLDDSSESFFYTWSELSIYPMDWFRVGMVAQRTKLYETDFDIQRGFLVGFSIKERVDLTTYVLNPDDDPTIVIGVAFNF